MEQSTINKFMVGDWVYANGEYTKVKITFKSGQVILSNSVLSKSVDEIEQIKLTNELIEQIGFVKKLSEFMVDIYEYAQDGIIIKLINYHNEYYTLNIYSEAGIDTHTEITYLNELQELVRIIGKVEMNINL